MDALRFPHSAATPDLFDSEALTLPVWGETSRGFPISLAASSLFTSASPSVERRQYGRLLPVWSSENFQIHFKGEELREDSDKEVWLQLMHLARGRAMSPEDPVDVVFTGNDFLRQLGWSNDGRSYKRLHECLDRLQFAQVKVTETSNGRRSRWITMSFISNVLGDTRKFNDSRAKITVRLDHYAAHVFSGGFICIDRPQRAKLTKTLSIKLADLIAAHSDPFSVHLSDLMKLLGSEAKSLPSFKQNIKRALDDLCQAEVIHHYTFEGQVLYVARTAETVINRGAPATVHAQIPEELEISMDD